MIVSEANVAFNLDWIIISVIVLVLCFFAIAFFSFQRIFRLWLQAFLSGSNVSLFDLLGMKFRRIDSKLVVECRIMSVQAGHPVSIRDLQMAYLSGADVDIATRAYIDAKKSGKDFTFDEMAEAERSKTLAKLLSRKKDETF